MTDTENKTKSLPQRIWHEAKLIFWVSIFTFVTEFIFDHLNLPAWPAASAKMDTLNQKILIYARNGSLIGLYNVYRENICIYKYGWRPLSWGHPFNTTLGEQKDTPVRWRTHARLHLKQLALYSDSLFKASRLHSPINNSPASDSIILDIPAMKAPVSIRHQVIQQSPQIIQHSWWEYLLAIPDTIFGWVGNNWSTKQDTANWPGRVQLVITFMIAFGLAGLIPTEDLEKTLWGHVALILIFLAALIIAAAISGLGTLVVYGAVFLVQKIGDGVYGMTGIITGIMAGRGFLTILLKEARTKFNVATKEKIVEFINKNRKETIKEID